MQAKKLGKLSEFESLYSTEKELIQSTIDEQTGKLTVAYYKKGLTNK